MVLGRAAESWAPFLSPSAMVTEAYSPVTQSGRFAQLHRPSKALLITQICGDHFNLAPYSLCQLDICLCLLGFHTCPHPWTGALSPWGLPPEEGAHNVMLCWDQLNLTSHLFPWRTLTLLRLWLLWSYTRDQSTQPSLDACLVMSTLTTYLARMHAALVP